MSASEERISVRWVLPETPMPEAVLHWRLMFGEVELASGQQTMNEKNGEVRIQAPETRTIVALSWQYELRRKNNQLLLQQGSMPIRVVPRQMLASRAGLFENKRLLVLDEREKLPALLSQNGIKMQRIADINTLELAQPDFVLIGENQLPTNPLADGMLQRLARRGCGIVVFNQTSRETLAGFSVILRPAHSILAIRPSGLNFELLTAQDISQWMREKNGELRAVRIPVGESALPLVYFSPGREDGTLKAGDLDALILSQTLGSGRIVLCQLPIFNWNEDARCQLLLSGLLDYLLTPVEQWGAASATAPSSQKKSNIYPKGESP